MKNIGGYLGLELGEKINSLTDHKYLFNSGRSACLFYLKKQFINNLWVPKYICRDFIDTLKDNGICIQFYNIDKSFEIQTNIKEYENVLYVNYFGVKDSYIKTISKQYNNLFIDNSQALFNIPIACLPTFYSLRKFIGVPDGGMLYVNDLLSTDDIPPSYSYEYSQHILKQVDKGTEWGYSDFMINEERIANSGILKMSNLSKKIIDSVNIRLIKEIRNKNFLHLNHNLSRYNEIELDKTSLYTFPLMVEDGDNLRKYLIDNKIFTATLWPDQLDFVGNDLEKNLIKNIVHIPIDQRYRKQDMNIIIKLIQKYYA